MQKSIKFDVFKYGKQPVCLHRDGHCYFFVDIENAVCFYPVIEKNGEPTDLVEILVNVAKEKIKAFKPHEYCPLWCPKDGGGEVK